jgi:Ser/Thr protein kinase RdoA (MazF antagonist)
VEAGVSFVVSDDLLVALRDSYGWERAAVAGPMRSSGLPPRAWRLETEQGACVLKRFTPEQRPAGELEADVLVWLGALPSPAYRTPSLVPTEDGAPLAGVGEDAYLVTRFEPGQFRSYTEFSRADWGDLGASLGALHARLRGHPLPGTSARLSARLAERDLERERQTLERTAAAALAREPGRREEAARYFERRRSLLVERGPRVLAEVCLALGEEPIHNDFNQHNYVFRAGAPPLITDWERALLAPAEYEVVRCLSLVPIADPDAARGFVAAYREQAPLRPSGLRFAVDACYVEHAVKHWPVEAWLRDEAWAEPHYHQHFDVVAELAGSRDVLDAFWEGVC